jgi:ribosomal protein S25
MGKFVLDGVTFDLNGATVTNVNGSWVVNTQKQENVASNVNFGKSKDEAYREKRREYQRNWLAKKNMQNQNKELNNLEIPTLTSMYESSIVDKLQFGSVAEQVRNKFPKVGSVGVVTAHSKQSIYSAFWTEKFKPTILGKVGENQWKFKRVS